MIGLSVKEYNFLFIFYIRTFVGYLVPQNVEHSTMIFFQFLLFAVKRKMKEERRRKIIFFPHCNHLCTVLCSTTQWMCLCDARTISWIMETDSSMGVIWTIGKVIYLDTYNDCKAHSFGKIKIWMMSIWFHDFFCSNKHHHWLEIFGKISYIYIRTAIKVLMGDILIRSEIM